MRSVERLIAAKRDGRTHTTDEVQRIVGAFMDGEMADCQMAAWLMAACIRGLDGDETVALTDAMARSGRMIDLSGIPGVKVDKHSTGGVGDSTTLVLAPLVASCGVPVAKMSGRGLGHTGGTLDKLESIPGFRVDIGPDAFIAQVRDIGVAVIAQSDDVVPADKRMYELRDLTATVSSVPLIVASVISKKLAGGADAIVLDVKCGSGAFMKDESQARALADESIRVGEALGRTVTAVMTDMSQPLGYAVGNALEVREAIETLRGDGPPDLWELCLVLGSEMLVAGRVAADEVAARGLLADAVESGRALATFARWIAAQGGDPGVAEDVSRLPVGAHRRVVKARSGGLVAAFDGEGVGRAAMGLGAGRMRRGEPVDPGAGIELAVKIGARVDPGDPLATLHTNELSRLDEAEGMLVHAISIIDGECAPPPLVMEIRR
ncbi:MAG: thymidine phosphorylase [Coriobacteriia bacterium]|nr:thymidine phosphorylase [Coriobacteriia bacterium]